MIKGGLQALEGDCLVVEASTLNVTLLGKKSHDVFNWLYRIENDIFLLELTSLYQFQIEQVLHKTQKQVELRNY